MIHLRAYRAIEEEESCLRYAAGHRKVLEGFNLGNVTTNSYDWAYNPHVFVVEATDRNTGDLLGGIRIQLADGKTNLPVQDAVTHFDPNINDMVRHYALNGGTGELCGLWNSRSLAPNVGVTLNLVLAGMAICEALPITSLFTIVAQYTMKIARRMGFQVESSLGKDGEFIYPNSNYVARVLSMDPNKLEHTYLFFKDKILALRDDPQLERVEEVDDKRIIFSHDLSLNKIDQIELAYE